MPWLKENRHSIFVVFGLFVFFIAVLSTAILYNPRPSRGAAIVWTGASSTNPNSWSNPDNWDLGRIPASADAVSFSSSYLVDCNIDANVNLGTTGSITISSGYTNTLTQTSNYTLTVGTFTQADGVFQGGSGNITINSTDLSISGGTFNNTSATLNISTNGRGIKVSGGTFNGGSATITTDLVNITGGVFNSTTGSMTIGDGGSGNCFYFYGGTFNHNSGTVALTTGACTLNSTQNLGFSALTINKSGNLTVSSTATTFVTSTLTLTSGNINTGTIEARGPISHTLSGGTGTLLINSTDTQTINLTGAGLPNVTLGSANATVNGPSSGTVTFAGLTMTTGTYNAGAGATSITGSFTQNGANSTVNLQGGTFTLTAQSFALSAGTFNQSNSDVSVNASTKTMTVSGGTFNGGSGSIATDGLSISGGSFQSTSGNLTIGDQGFNVTAGSFVHNNGTVTIEQGNRTHTYNVDTTVYNLTINKTGTLTLAGTNSLIVAATTTLTNGTISGNTFYAQGNVVIESGFDGGTAPLVFSGSNSQTFDLTGGTATFNADITLNKSDGAVTLASDLVLDAASQDLFITAGTLALAGNTVTTTGTSGKLQVGADGTLRLNGNEAINANAGYPTFASGSTVEYVGTAAPYTLKNYAYSNLTINGAGNVFSLPATLPVGNNLTITTGTLYLAGYNLAVSTGTFSNTGILRLQGGETVTITNDSNSGTVEYVGDGDAGAADTYAIKAFDYYNLWINSTDANDVYNSTASTSFNVNNDFTITKGEYQAPSGNLNVTGNFSNAATFTHNSGTVVLNGGSQTLTGTTTFNIFTKSVVSAYTLTFPYDSLITFVGTTTLSGAASNALSLRSSLTDTQAHIDAQGNRLTQYLDVKDNYNENVSAISCLTGCTDSGNNYGWTFVSEPPHFVVLYNSTSTLSATAGTGYVINLVLRDASNATSTSYTGDKTITFSGANASPNGTEPTCTDKTDAAVNFGTGATINFASGVATCTLKLYMSESISVDITDGTYDSTTSTDHDLDVNVAAATLNNFALSAPASANSGVAFDVNFTAHDAYNNTTTLVSGDTTLSVNQSGNVLPATIADTNFTDDGIHTASVTISNITEQPSVTLTATNGSATGTDSIAVLGTPADPSGAAASRVTDNLFSISWSDNSTVETGYKVERRDDTGSGFGAWAEVASTAANATSTTDATTVSDARYEYRVVAFNDIGNSSSYSTDAVTHYTTPDTPSDVTGSYVSDSEFSVSWADNAAVVNTHRVGRCSNGNCDSTYETDLGTSSTSPVSDTTSIAANSRYRWEARAESPDSVNSSYAYSSYGYTTPAMPTIGTPAWVSDGEITVTWTDNSSYEDGFRVYVSADGGAYSEVTPGTNTVGAGVQTYAYSGSSANHSYKFKVLAHVPSDLTAESGESDTIYTTPTAPTIGTATRVSDGEITVTWTDNSSYEDGFRVYVSADGGAYSEVTPGTNTVGAGVQTYSYASSTANHYYNFKVRAHTSNNLTADSSASNAVYTTPAAPTIGTAAYVSDSEITVNWTDNSTGEDGFRVFVSVDDGAYAEVTVSTNTVAAGVQTYSYTGSSANHSYNFKVQAHTSNDLTADSGASNTIYTTPAAPTIGALTWVSDSEITVAWTDNSSYEDGFRIFVSADGGAYSEVTASTNTVAAGVQTYSYTGSSANHSYNFKVRAHTSNDLTADSAASDTIYTTPTAPTIGTATRVSDGEITVTWTDNSAYEDGFRVFVSADGGAYGEVTASTNTVATDIQTYSYTGSSANHSYNFKVQAHTSNDLTADSGASNAVYTTPAAPSGTGATYVSDAEFTVEWTDNSAFEDGFRIERRDDGGTWTEITTTSAGSYSDTGTTANHKYEYRVRAYKDSLNSTYATDTTEYFTTPSAPTIGTPTADSTSSITWTWTDNSNYEDSFRLDFVTGSGTDVDGITADSTSKQITGLSVNTQYAVHIHAYRADRGESAASSDSSAVYTLANVPSALSLAVNSVSSITASWSDNSNPAGTEYYVENVTAGTNSGWITATTWDSTDLTCNTSYSFQVKARNGDNTVTLPTDAVAGTTSACPASSSGGGIPPSSVVKPSGTLGVSINNGLLYTNNPVVALKLLGGDAVRMAISNSPDFSGAAQEDVASEKVWTLPLPDGLKTIYVKFYTAAGQASDVIIAQINLDTTAPTVQMAGEQQFTTNQDVLLTGFTDPGAHITVKLDGRTRSPILADAVGNWMLGLGRLPIGTYTLEMSAVDQAGNNGTIASFSIDIIYGGELAQEKPVEGETAVKPAEEGIVVGQLLGKLADKIKELVTPAAPTTVAIPLVTTVPKEAPPVLRFSWNFLPVSKFIEAPLPKEIRSLAQKFPDVGQTLADVGVNRLTDINKLSGVSLTLPGLTKSAGLEPVEVGGTVGTSGHTLPLAGLSLAQLSAEAKNKLPSEVMFAKVAGDSVDLNSKVTIDEEGHPIQKITTISGRQLQLIVKPAHPVKAVKGYVVFKTKAKPQARTEGDKEVALETVLAQMVFGAPAFAEPVSSTMPVEEKLVLLEFEYTDPDGDGIYTANIPAPVMDGEYEILTVMDYENPELGAKEIKLVTVVDPEGYVYEQVGDQQLRVRGAVVSLYWLNPASGKYEMWPAKNFQQENPQNTDITGRYAFLVPEGKYYAKVEAKGYRTYTGEAFDVTEGSGVHTNIEMTKSWKWLRDLDWKIILLLAVILLLGYNFYHDYKLKRALKK